MHYGIKGIGILSALILFFGQGVKAQGEKTLSPQARQDENVTTVLFLGDSLTAGYHIDKEKTYVARLEKKWKREGKNIKFYNGSVSGSTTASAIPRLKWYKKASPDILFLALGANDGLRGIKLETTRENLRKAITWAKEHNMKVVLAGMLLPPNYGEDYTQKFKKLYRELAKEMNVELIPFLLKGVAAEKELNLEDGIHPNENGHEVMMRTVEKALEPLL